MKISDFFSTDSDTTGLSSLSIITASSFQALRKNQLARPWETQHGSSSHDPQGQLALLCDNKLLENNNLGGKRTVIKSQLVDFSTN